MITEIRIILMVHEGYIFQLPSVVLEMKTPGENPKHFQGNVNSCMQKSNFG